MNNFFQDLDGRIFTFDLSGLFTGAFLFNNDPANFPFYSWAMLLALMGLGFSGFVLWYYKKNRSRLNLELPQRKIVRRHAKIGLGIFGGYLVFIIMRLLNVPVVGMRFVGYLLLLAALINVVVTVVLARQVRYTVITKERESAGQDDYAKYLPKKRKK